jgi:hypothetical protein
VAGGGATVGGDAIGEALGGGDALGGADGLTGLAGTDGDGSIGVALHAAIATMATSAAGRKSLDIRWLRGQWRSRAFRRNERTPDHPESRSAERP